MTSRPCRSTSSPRTADVAPTGRDVDPLREQLLEAAARVFASKGYDGTKIMDIVKAAGLSAGAVYGRFESKDELLREAVLSRVERTNAWPRLDGHQVVELMQRAAGRAHGALSDTEAMHLEAYIAARREPELAAAIAEARTRWRAAIEPLVQRAVDDGALDGESDIESVLFFLQTLHLGLLVQRGAGVAPASSEGWTAFVRQIVEAMAPAAV